MKDALAVIGAALAIVLSLLKLMDKKSALRREQLDLAKEDLLDAQKNNDASGRVFAWRRINRLRR